MDQVTRTIIERELHTVINSAVEYGVTVQEFRKLARQMWDDELIEKRRYDERAWLDKEHG